MQGTNWVKTEDELPAHGCEVIIYSERGVTHGHYDDGRYLKKPVGKWFSGNRLHNGIVTHWCKYPLPPMPEGEKS